MSAIKPVYSRPSDDEPTPAPKKKRKRRHKRKYAAPTAVNESFTPHEDDGAAFHDPITEAKSIAKRDHLQNDGITKRDPITTAKGMAKRHPLQDDGDAVAEHHPTGTDGQNLQNTSFDHHKRNRRTHQRAKRRARELRAENELLHRRLAAIYDALTLN